MNPRPPVAIRLAVVLLGYAVIVAGSAGFAGRSAPLAWLLAVCAIAGIVGITARGRAAVVVSITAAVIASICWAVIEARTRHVLYLASTVPVCLAALLLVRPDSRDYLAGTIEVHGRGQTSTDGS